MVGHTNLEDQVEADFADARRRALLRNDRSSDGLLCFDDLRELPGATARVYYRGVRTSSSSAPACCARIAVGD
jgi:hypothetical protein